MDTVTAMSVPASSPVAKLVSFLRPAQGVKYGDSRRVLGVTIKSMSINEIGSIVRPICRLRRMQSTVFLWTTGYPE